MVGGLSWGCVGPSWGYVGLSWGQCGPILGLYWPSLGAMLPDLWGLRWSILGLSWPILGAMLPHVGAMLIHLEAYVGPCWPILSHNSRKSVKNGKSTKHRKTREFLDLPSGRRLGRRPLSPTERRETCPARGPTGPSWPWHCRTAVLSSPKERGAAAPAAEHPPQPSIIKKPCVLQCFLLLPCFPIFRSLWLKMGQHGPT